MATKKMPILKFVAGLKEARKRKDGYIMGAKGQDPKKWPTSSWYFTQYSGAQKKKALYWRENAKRVWDCNGLAEGLYEDYTGVNINTQARYNYSGWCGTKGSGKIPANYRVPGAAVFIYSSSAGYITHVGYLEEPVDDSKPAGDWWVTEARGVMYGVVRTKLSERGWNRWGLMTKYFDYSEVLSSNKESLLGKRNLKNGCIGTDVKQMQEGLIRLGYDCGKWGADGDFGDGTEKAVRAFQREEGLIIDGIFGKNSAAAMEKALAEFDTVVSDPTKVEIVGGDCYIRTDSKLSASIAGVAKQGSKFDYAGKTASNGWNSIKYDGATCWVSGKYSKLVQD